MIHDIAKVAAAFDMRGEFMSAKPYGSGHINDTYAACYEEGGGIVRYIHQRINHSIFKDPPSLMDNVCRVTEHQRRKLIEAGVDDLTRRALTLIPTLDGESFHRDADGNFWRTYIFIEKAQTYDQIENTDQAFQAAKAFGEFQKQLVDLPGERLSETIPSFHDTRRRFEALQAAIDADTCNRATDVASEIEFASSRASIVGVLVDLQEKGLIPEVTTHNDTKLNNVMIDDETNEGVCVIDLDTVMPGLSLYDFGDMVRTAARPTPEDETDLSRVVARMSMFEAVTRGYLESAGDVLNQVEKDHLAFSARLITFEIGIRFLTDYLQGDVYFKTHRPGHNRDRCHVQFKMVESFEAHEDQMNRCVQKLG